LDLYISPLNNWEKKNGRDIPGRFPFRSLSD